MFPQIDTPNAGPLTERDLDQARQHSTGRIYHLRRVTIAGRDTCNGSCESHTGCDCTPGTVPCAPAEACTELGADAVGSMRRHYRTRATVGLALALAVAGYLAHVAWPSLG